MPIHWKPLLLNFPNPELPDPERALTAGLKAALAASPVRGLRVAVAVGSRGICHIDRWVRITVAVLRRAGAEVLVVPAMGSHGGGTPAAQAAVLADLGITKKSVGAPVVSRGEVVQAGATATGLPVWVDAAAWNADRVVPINRVKPHTAFQGLVESGPAKLLAVGLGKNRSAAACHRSGLDRAIQETTTFWLDSGRVPCGVALVENATHGIAELRVLQPTDWLADEDRLLRRAKKLLPRLPWQELDLLVVREIGKDISGTGMDLNVIGMGRRFPEREEPPHIHRVVAVALSRSSRGNANGVGYADWITESLLREIDWEITFANARTTGFADAVRRPRVAPNETEAVAAALAELIEHTGVTPQTVRAVRIRNTSRLAEVEVSPALARSPYPIDLSE